MGSFLSDSSNQRKIAVALCAFLALFSSKVPFLADVNPAMLMTLIGAVAVWINQSGKKAAAEAVADGARHAALIANATDSMAVFKHITDGVPLPANLIPANLPAQPGAPSVPS